MTLQHIYDGETGKLIRSQEPAIDPLETKLHGYPIYVQYPYSTEIPLPEYGEHECPYFINGAWVVKGEWKNIEVYNTESKNFEYCYTEELGENQIWIDDKEGIKKFKDNFQQYIVNEDLKIVPNPDYELLQQKQALNEQLSKADQDYNEFLNTPIQFTNGCMYKVKWIDDGTYTKLITGAQAGLVKFPIEVWDATEKAENMRSMSQEEFGQLCAWLALTQQQAFNTRKQLKSSILSQLEELEEGNE